MEPSKFWDHIRSKLFYNKISEKLKSNIDIIIDTYYSYYLPNGKVEDLAYILATVYHECYHKTLNPHMNPIREGFAKTNQGAINAVTKLYNSGRIRRNYALPNSKGLSYYGRGFVQITHEYNYEKLGNRIGEDLVNNPDLALDPKIAAKILVIGSVEGLFTGIGVGDSDDYVQDRKVINGLDKAELIAGYAKEFETALKASING